MNFKKTLSLTLCGALALSAAGCAAKTAAPASSAFAESEPAVEKTVDDFAGVDLQTICDANNMEAMAARGSQVQSDYEYTNPDGSSGGTYQTYFVINDMGMFSYYRGEEEDENGDKVDYESVTTDNQRFERDTFIDGTVSTYMTPIINYPDKEYDITMDEDEKVLGRTYSNGILTLTTEVEIEPELQDFFSDLTLTTEQFDYQLDGETLQLLGYEKYGVEADGTRHLYLTLKNTLNPTNLPEIPDYVTDYLQNPPTENLRTITFHYLDGSETQSYTLPNTWLTNVYLFLCRGDDYMLYADEAGTQEYLGVAPAADGTMGDVTVYVGEA